MKVLFVCSGNSTNFPIVPFIKTQGDSLEEAGLKVDYFAIKGKGLLGYLKSGLKLRKFIKTNQYDIIHAHFTLSGWTAVIGSKKTPVVLSLMGTDALGDHTGNNKINIKNRLYPLLTLLIQPFVAAIISKAPNIEKYVYLKGKSHIVPNGVNTSIFRPFTNGYREELGLDEKKKYVLFLGNKEKPVKNYSLARQALESLKLTNVELINPYPLPHTEVPKYLNSVNVLVVPSFMEGSPNVVKEAMACNCPIVATDVGDIKWVLAETEGCFISSFNSQDFALKIQSALEFSDNYGRTTGKQKISELGLSVENVARRLIDIYTTVQVTSANRKKIRSQELIRT